MRILFRTGFGLCNLSGLAISVALMLGIACYQIMVWSLVLQAPSSDDQIIIGIAFALTGMMLLWFGIPVFVIYWFERGSDAFHYYTRGWQGGS